MALSSAYSTAANPGMKSAALDLENLPGPQAFAAEIARPYPSLNVLINNAAIMKTEPARGGSKLRSRRGDGGN